MTIPPDPGAAEPYRPPPPTTPPAYPAAAPPAYPGAPPAYPAYPSGPPAYPAYPPGYPAYPVAGHQPHQAYGGPRWPSQPPRARVRGNRIGAVFAQVGLGAAILVQGLVARAVVHQKHTLHDAVNGTGTVSAVQDADHAAKVVQNVGIAATLLVAIAFIVWLYRLRLDADSFHPELQSRGPGWAIGSWFIPFGNLVLPYLVVADVISASDTPLNERYGIRRTPPLVKLWWTAWVLFRIVGWIVTVNDPTSVHAFDTHTTAVVVVAVGTAVAGLLAIAVVERMTRSNARQWQHVTAAWGW